VLHRQQGANEKCRRDAVIISVKPSGNQYAGIGLIGAYCCKIIRTTKWNWNETFSKLFRDCFISVYVVVRTV